MYDETPGNPLMSRNPEVSRSLETLKKDVDYTSIVTPEIRALVFGEAHYSEIAKTELIQNIQTLKALGITHLGIEFIPADNQPLVNEYQKSGSGREQITEFFKGYGRENSYIDIIDAATSAQVHVVGIDISQKEREQQKSELSGSVDKLVDKSDPMGSLIKVLGAHSQQQKGQRDRNFATVINDVLQRDPDSKIAIFVGKEHASKNSDSMGGILANWGMQVRCVSLEAEDEFTFGDTFLARAKTEKLSSARFMIPGSDVDTLSLDRRLLPRVDWVVHIPKIQ